MSKYHFTVRHQNKTFKCQLDTEGELTVFNGEGESRVVAVLKSIDDIEYAKTIAREMIVSMGW